MALTRRDAARTDRSGRRRGRRLSRDGGAGACDPDAGRRGEFHDLPPSSGNGRSVVILGAGIAGLVSAYELQRAGYRVTVLEARDRIGGRAWTIRGGDRIVQTGRPDQVATFDHGTLFQRRSGAPPVHAPRDPRLRARVRRAARDVRQRQPQRRLGFRREGPARAAHGRRHARPSRRAARQGDRPACARPGGAQGRARRMFASSSPPTPQLDDKGQYTPGGLVRLFGRRRRLQPGARSPPAAWLQGACAVAGDRPCLICSSISGTCRRRCSSRSAAWIGSPTRFTNR